MKKKILLVLLLIISIISLTACESNDDPNNTNKIETVTLGGEIFTSKDITKNKLTVLNVWGTWCPPCIAELPELEKANKTFKNKDVEIVGVLQDGIKNHGERNEEVIKSAEKILTDAGVTYRIILPDEYLSTEFIGKMQYFPTTFFLNEKGEVIKTETGAHNAEEWSVLINEALAELEK